VGAVEDEPNGRVLGGFTSVKVCPSVACGGAQIAPLVSSRMWVGEFGPFWPVLGLGVPARVMASAPRVDRLSGLTLATSRPLNSPKGVANPSGARLTKGAERLKWPLLLSP